MTLNSVVVAEIAARCSRLETLTDAFAGHPTPSIAGSGCTRAVVDPRPTLDAGPGDRCFACMRQPRLS